MVDDDIDDIIRKGEVKTKELNSKYAGLDLDALNNFRSESLINQWEGEDFAAKRRNMIWIEPAKRERKGNYSIDQYYRDNMKVTAPKPDKPKVPRPPKQVQINDFQFFPPRLSELQAREQDAYLKAQNYVVPVRTELEEGETAEEAEQKRKEEQARIDNGECDWLCCANSKLSLLPRRRLPKRSSWPSRALVTGSVPTSTCSSRPWSATAATSSTRLPRMSPTRPRRRSARTPRSSSSATARSRVSY